MTRYELKDKDKQAKYLAVFPDFLEALKYGIKKQIDPRWVTVASGVLLYKVTLPIEEVEAITEYDPNQWNRYPDITPPSCVWMRVETWSASGATIHHALMFQNGAWRKGIGLEPIAIGKVARFRPWDDDKK